MALNPEPGFKYAAFLSYSHADRKVARWLHRRLERYVLPRRLRQGHGRRNATRPLRPVFLDETELVPGQRLPERIREALEQSEFLVVLCSPAAARSGWVEREIVEFAALGRGTNILAVVVSGEPHAVRRGLPEEWEALPAALRFQLRPMPGAAAWEISPTAEEPLWVDIKRRWWGGRTAFLRIVAALLALPSFDELDRRDFRARWLRGATIALASLVLIATLWLVARLPGSFAERYFDRMIRSDALEIAAALEDSPEGELELARNIARDTLYLEPYSGNYWQVEELTGGRWRPVVHSRSLWDRLLVVEPQNPAPLQGWASYDSDFGVEDERLRFGVQQVEHGKRNLRIVVARSREELDQERAAVTPIVVRGGLAYLAGFLFWLVWRGWQRIR